MAITLLATIFAIGAPSAAYADPSDFTVTNFVADYFLDNHDPQGRLRVVEHISVDFSDYNHGILRSLPKHYKQLPLNIAVGSVTSATGAPAQYEISDDSNDNEILKIGDPDRTITGPQEYTISYAMQNVISFYNDHDELYWDVNGTDWSQPFTHVSVELHAPQGMSFARTTKCYSGAQNSTASDCRVTQTANEVIVHADSLGPHQTLTFVAAFPTGYFHAPSWTDYAQEYILGTLQFFGPFLVLGGAGFIWWLKRGRDAKGTGIIVPQYDAPADLSPLEVGTVVDFQVDNRDLTATIIDLAIRKYLRIVESDKTKLLVAKTKTYSLELRNDDWSKLNQWERQLMGALFGVGGEDKTVQMSDLAHKLVQDAKTIKNSVLQSLTDRDYFVANPKRYTSITLGTVVLIPIAFIWIFGLGHLGWLVWGFIAGGCVLALFYHFLGARTAKGVAANEHILGLKLYLNVAEKDRIKMLQSPDARYAAHADAPAQTVDLFEKLLPYAVALKVEKQWAQKFEAIYTTPPDWYVGNYAAFNAGYLVGSLGGGFSDTLGSSFATQSSSSGSGFGGGGFSGGGGGGGGGGGW